MTKSYKSKKKFLTHAELKEFISTALGYAILEDRIRFIDEFYSRLPGKGKGVKFVMRTQEKK